MEEIIVKELLSKGLIFVLLAYAAYVFYKRDIEREKKDFERAAKIEERFESLRTEREKERLEMFNATNQLVEVLRDNTATMKSVQGTMTEMKNIIIQLTEDIEDGRSNTNIRRKS